MADGMPSEREYRAGRSDSTASASSTGSAASPSSHREMHLPPPIASKVPTWPGRPANEQQQGPHRRPSHTLFEGLAAQKRKDDPASVARRQSLNEQRPPAGFFGQMWNKCVVSILFYSLSSLFIIHLAHAASLLRPGDCCPCIVSGTLANTNLIWVLSPAGCAAKNKPKPYRS
jgi:hypothetical protein